MLSQLVKQVYSSEIVAALAEEASARLRRLGCGNVEIRSGDGYHGWEEHAPFDGIIVTTATPNIPLPLIAQRKSDARLAIPLGAPFGHQVFSVVTKDVHDEIDIREVFHVAFVPLTGSHERRSGVDDEEAL